MEWSISKKGAKRRFYFYVWLLTLLIYFSIILLFIIAGFVFDWGMIAGIIISLMLLFGVTLLAKYEYLESGWSNPLKIEINEEGIFSKEIFIKRKFVKETKILWSEIFRVVVSKNKKRILILFKKNRKNMYWTLQMLFLDTDDEKEIKKKIIDHIIAYAEKKNIEIVNKNLHIIAPGAIYPSSLVREISENLKIEGGDV